MDVSVYICVCLSALLFKLVYVQVSIHHPYTSRVLSGVLEVATTEVFLVCYVGGVVMTNNLHPAHMDMQDVIQLHLHPPPLL